MSGTAGTFRGAWSHGRWRWFVTSFGISTTGDFLYSVALVVVLLDRTGSAAWVSAAIVARMVPYVLLSAPAGVLADRFDRRRLMRSLDLARAVFMAAMAAVVWFDGPPAMIVGIAALSAAASTPHRSAAAAATPQLVGEDDLAAANAAESVIAQGAWFIGPALGAAIVTVSNPSVALVINALTFTVSALLLSRIGDVGPEANDTTGDEHQGFGAGLADGVTAVRSDPGLSALVILICALLFTFGMEQVLHVLVAVDRLGMGAAWVGVMGAAIGAGGVLVAPFTARIGRSGTVGTWLIATCIGVAAPMVLLSATSSPPVVLALLGVEGAATIVNEVLLITLLQRAAPDQLLGRIFGLQESASAATQLLGSILAPVLVTVAGLGVALWVGGGVTVVAAVLSAPAVLALAARAEHVREELAPTIDRLRQLALFADASEAALERLARAAQPVQIPAGGVVIREGDEPDDLYVVEHGELVVRSTGEIHGAEREINRMGPNDWFGEIGLLRGIPRTATVQAVTDCELLRIPGDVFTATFATPDILPDPVRRTIGTRLARTHPSVGASER